MPVPHHRDIADIRACIDFHGIAPLTGNYHDCGGPTTQKRRTRPRDTLNKGSP
jgi:hypothetical protein